MKQDVTLRDIYSSIQEFRDEVRSVYATKEELKPIKAITYGLAGTALMAVLNLILKTTGL